MQGKQSIDGPVLQSPAFFILQSSSPFPYHPQRLPTLTLQQCLKLCLYPELASPYSAGQAINLTKFHSPFNSLPWVTETQEEKRKYFYVTLSDSLTDSHLLRGTDATKWENAYKVLCLVTAPVMCQRLWWYCTMSSATQGLTTPALSFTFTKVFVSALSYNPLAGSDSHYYMLLQSPEPSPFFLSQWKEPTETDVPPSRRERTSFLKELFVQKCCILNAFYTDSVISIPPSQCISIPLSTEISPYTL